MYLTVERFKHMGFGVDLDGVEDWELASMLDRATALANDYCAVPRSPIAYDFRGGTVTDETYPWRPMQIRVFPRFKPIKAISSFRIYATNDSYVEIAPNDIFIEPIGGWAEIISLSLSPVGFWSASGIVSLVQPVAKYSYTYGHTFVASKERAYPIDGWQYRSNHQFWNTSPAVEVFINDVATTSGWVADYTEGTITFNAPRAAGDIVTLNYTYPMPSEIGQAVGHITSSLVSERALVGAGLGNLAEIQVEEVRLRRDPRRAGTGTTGGQTSVIPEVAKDLLNPYVFITVR